MKITKDKRSKLEKEIDEAIDVMSVLTKWSDEYRIMADNLEKLMKAQSYDAKRQVIKIETLLTIGGNLAGILLILNYEKLDIVTSKAIGFVLKGRGL